MTTCLVLGSAACLPDDLAAYDGPCDGVVACNAAGTAWPGRLDAWVTGHPDHMLSKGWLRTRRERGYPDAPLWTHDHPHLRRIKRAPDLTGFHLTKCYFPGQHASGSSGLFAAKVTLLDLGFDDVVLCGVPMMPEPHIDDRAPWPDAVRFRRPWEALSGDIKARMRSMSGWTRELLGGPGEYQERKEHGEKGRLRGPAGSGDGGGRPEGGSALRSRPQARPRCGVGHDDRKHDGRSHAGATGPALGRRR